MDYNDYIVSRTDYVEKHSKDFLRDIRPLLDVHYHDIEDRFKEKNNKDSYFLKAKNYTKSVIKAPFKFAIDTVKKSPKISAVVGSVLASGCVTHSGIHVDNNDPDNDGIPSEIELIIDTDPLRPTLLVEMDFHESGRAVYKDGKPVLTTWPHFSMDEIDKNKVLNPMKSYFSQESIDYLVDLFDKNGIDLVIDHGESKLFSVDNNLTKRSANRGGQVLEYPTIDKQCVGDYMPPINMSHNITFHEDECYAYDRDNKTNHYLDELHMLPSDRTPWMTYDQAEEFYKNSKYFGKNREGTYHYMIVGGSNVMDPHDENDLSLGVATLGGRLSIVSSEYTSPRAEVPVWLHEMGHSLLDKNINGSEPNPDSVWVKDNGWHSDDKNNVMYPTTQGVMNYTKSQWDYIKEYGLKNALRN